MDASADALAVQIQKLTALQAQQEAVLKELQQTRKEMADSLATSSNNNALQLAAAIEMIDLQRKQDLKTVRDAQRVGLALLVCVTGMLLVSVLILNVTSIRAISRMTRMLAGSAFTPGSQAQVLADVREAQNQMLLFPGEHGAKQLDNALHQLQSRIQSLENLAHTAPTETSVAEANASAAKPPISVTPLE